MQTCCSCDVNKPRYIMMTLAGFAFVFVYEAIVHGVLLVPYYRDTLELWRSQSEMRDFYPVAILAQYFFTAVAAYVFTRNFEGKGICEGVRFGTMIGLLVGIALGSFYAFMPITMEIAIAWLVTSVIECIGLGVVFSLIYKNKSAAA